MNRIRAAIQAIDERRVPDATRRTILLAATGAVGGAGLIGASVPFVASLQPSAAARARGGQVDVHIGSLAAAELRTVEWRGMPVWLLRRTDAMVRAL